MIERQPAGDPSDAALVGAWQAGDERAATTLVKRHASALGRFLYGAGAPPDAVEDLVQETFIKAFRGLDGWRGEASFRSWLFRIGSNLRKDQFRRERGRQVVPLDDADLPSTADPLGEAEASEAGRRIEQGLTGLPRLQREVFLLRAQQGMEYDEIALALGTTAGAARVHYHHAVKRLKELIA
jgi:RNA polymerase sigma-70 factor (ECF subfamily)